MILHVKSKSSSESERHKYEYTNKDSQRSINEIETNRSPTTLLNCSPSPILFPPNRRTAEPRSCGNTILNTCAISSQTERKEETT